MKKFHAKRLLKLAAFLETVPRKQFDINWWLQTNECGTVACVLGWACMIPSFNRTGLKFSDGIHQIPTYRNLDCSDAGMEFFGLDNYLLFSVRGYENGYRVTPKQAAKQIRKVVKRKFPDLVRGLK